MYTALNNCMCDKYERLASSIMRNSREMYVVKLVVTINLLFSKDWAAKKLASSSILKKLVPCKAKAAWQKSGFAGMVTNDLPSPRQHEHQTNDLHSMEPIYTFYCTDENDLWNFSSSLCLYSIFCRALKSLVSSVNATSQFLSNAGCYASEN